MGTGMGIGMDIIMDIEMGTDTDIDMGTMQAEGLDMWLVIELEVHKPDLVIFIETEQMVSVVLALGLPRGQQLIREDLRLAQIQVQGLQIRQTAAGPRHNQANREPGRIMFIQIKVAMFINGIIVATGSNAEMANGINQAKGPVKAAQII